MQIKNDKSATLSIRTGVRAGLSAQAAAISTPVAGNAAALQQVNNLALQIDRVGLMCWG